MANPVVNTAVCTCSFGTVPMALPVSSQQTVMMGGMLAATIMDNKCPTFGMCCNPANPAVAAANSCGVSTPNAECVRSGHRSALGAGGADRIGWRQAAFEQYQQIDVHVWRRDTGDYDAGGDRADTIKGGTQCGQKRYGRWT